MVTAIPGPTLTRNSQCQENRSVRYPPIVGPIVGARVATRPITGEISACRPRKMV